MGTRKVWLGVMAAATAAMLLSACGDDDEPARAASAGNSASAFCRAALAWNTPPDPADHEFDQDWFETVLRPRFDDLETHAPESIAGEVAAIAAALDGGDEAEGRAADLRIARFAADDCGWRRVAISAVDHAFEGAPTTVSAGVVAFDVTNEGDEAHMVKLVRRRDGVTASFTELLDLPEDAEDDALQTFEPEEFLDPGQQGVAVADLAPGSYALVCELAVGTRSTAEVTGSGSGPTHADEGMVHEFTVEAGTNR